jgi:hypothetical protein
VSAKRISLSISQSEVQPHIERFLGFVEKTSEDSCWYRLTRGRENGYTTITFDRRRVSAHRFSYAAFRGNVGGDQEIDHLCRDRACVNPNHLELVTRKENLKRRNTIYDSNAWVGDPIKRLMSRVEKSKDSCWVWNGALVRGYGVININNKTEYVHRVVFAAYSKKFNKRLTLDHKCRNPRCVNPDHLEPVSRSENIRRMNMAQPRNKCRKGHLYSEYGKTKSGMCIKCYENSPSRRKNSEKEPKPYKQLVRSDYKTHCSNGHEYSQVGRFASGNCRQCQANKDSKRGKRKSVKVLEQLCSRGHDTWVSGRLYNGHCKACLTNGFCSNGHDISISGKTPNGKCMRCDSERRSRYSKSALSKQFCPNQHDTFLLGRSPAGACSECARIYARKKNGYTGTLKDLVLVCKNGHTRTKDNTLIKSKLKQGKKATYRECKICINERNKRYKSKKQKAII